MPSEVSRLLQEKWGPESGLSATEDERAQWLEKHHPALAMQLLTHLRESVASSPSFSEVFVDYILAYDFLSKGAEVYPEPTVNGAGKLELRPPTEGEKRSDWAVKPDLPTLRWVNVEAKTPNRDDRRTKSDYGIFYDDFRDRMRRRWESGLTPTSINITLFSRILVFKGGDAGKVMKEIERRAVQLVESGSGLEAAIPVEYDGANVAELRLMPGTGAIGTGVGLMPAARINPGSLVDRKQLANNVPNVVVVNLYQELLPFPALLAADFEAIFQKGKLTNVSAMVLLEGPGDRQVVKNPKARAALTAEELEFFRLAPPPP